tara:strand:- start:1109 stop:1930 length:822 start_codon:yes stop_codon:yes gene_type:complete
MDPLKSAPRRRVGAWEIGAELGEGYSSAVYLVENVKNGRAAAMKIIDIQKFSKYYEKHLSQEQIIKLLYEEAQIMSNLSHRNIVKIYEAFVSQNYFYICMELVTGSMVLDLIPRSGMCENKAKTIMRQIFDAVEYLHAHDVVHGDIKVENIMVDNATGFSTLIDMGFSQRVKSGQSVKAIGWTRLYAPPEAFRVGRLSKAWDIWSCGVVLYALLTGFFPFDDKKVDWTSDVVPELVIPSSLSDDSVDLLLALLRIRPEKRLTAAEAKEMAFLL